MKKGTRGEARTHVSVPPEKVYDLVSDVTRMGEWSPETVRCEWLDGATGPAVGARFKGSNKAKLARWSTKPRVVAAEAGKEFAFVVPALLGGKEQTKWTYRFEEAAGGGTEVTESFELMSDMPGYIVFADRFFLGIPDRKANLEGAMQQTLDRIKAVAEGSA
ncbi:MAG: polyketide cyclase [Acidimicrobiales bacterium]|nr:polyketide cyclase [Acidimicrobiales bacterium]